MKTYQVGNAVFTVTPEGDVEYNPTPEQFLFLLPELTSMFPGKGLEKLQNPSEQDKVTCLCREWASVAASFALETDERCGCSFSASEEGVSGWYSTTSGTQLRVEGLPYRGGWYHSTEDGNVWVEPEHQLRFTITIPGYRRNGNHDRRVREVLGLPVSRLSTYQKMVQKRLHPICVRVR